MNRTSKSWALALVLGSVLFPAGGWTAPGGEPHPPAIRKLGTLDLDMVETTPVVFRDRLYRFEYVRPSYPSNKTIITYSWGNQQGTEFLAEALFDGPLPSFLKGFFP